MFPFGFQHLRVQIWTHQMSSSVLKPSASSGFFASSVGWLVVSCPPCCQMSPRHHASQRKKKKKNWLRVCWGLARKGSFTLDGRVCQSACNVSTDVIREGFFFQMETCCQIWVLCGSESHKVAKFEAIPGWMSCLNRFVLWWAAGIADVTPKRKAISSKTTYRPRHATTPTFDLSRSSLTTMLKSGKPSIGSPKSTIITMDIPPVKETQRVSRQTPPTPSISPRQPLSAAACPYLAFCGFPECFRYTITKGKGNQESALTGRHNKLWCLMITYSTCQVFV